MHAHINIQRYKSSAVFFYLIWTLSLEMSDEPDMIANNAEALIKAMEKDMNMSFLLTQVTLHHHMQRNLKNQDVLYIKVTRLCM